MFICLSMQITDHIFKTHTKSNSTINIFTVHCHLHKSLIRFIQYIPVCMASSLWARGDVDNIQVHLHVLQNVVANLTGVHHSSFNTCTGYNLTRLPYKAKARMASRQGSHWLIESPTFLIYV